MIAFKDNTELEIIDSYNEATDNIDECHNETFKAGEPVDADIVDDDGSGYVTLQFGGGGGIATTVQKECFTVLPD